VVKEGWWAVAMDERTWVFEKEKWAASGAKGIDYEKEKGERGRPLQYTTLGAARGAYPRH